MGTIKFSVNRKRLIEIIQLAHDTAKQNKILPVLSKILLEVSATNLRVTANNLANLVSLTMDYFDGKGDVDTGILLDGEALLGVLKIGDAEDVILTIKDGESITIGKSKIKNAIDRQEFPLTPVFEGKTATVKSLDLAVALNAVKHCAATEESRPILAGLHFKFSENTLSVAGADGYVLGHTTIGVDVAEPFSVTVPIKSIGELRKFLLSQCETSVSLCVGNRFVVTSGENYFATVMVEGNYPDFNAIMKGINESYTQVALTSVTLKDFTNNLRLCDNFTEKSAPVKINLTQREQLGEVVTLVTVFGEGEQGSHAGEIEVEFSYTKDIKIAFNPKYLQQALAQFDECVFRVKDGASPAGISSGNTQYVIMPMHIGR